MIYRALCVLICFILLSVEQSFARVGICDRTPEVQKEILRQIDKEVCDDVEDEDLQEVTEMLLNNKDLEEIRPQDFDGLVALQIVDISNNHIKALPDGFLSHVPVLEKLDVSHNELRSFPDGFLSHAPVLKDFNASSNQLGLFCIFPLM